MNRGETAAPTESFERLQIVVLSSIEWDAAWQRHQIFATQLAKRGHEVFFVENTGFRNPTLRDLPRLMRKAKGLLRQKPSTQYKSPPKNLHIVNPLAAPPTHAPFRAANAAWFLPSLTAKLRRMGLRRNPLALVYLPTATTLRLIRLLEPSMVVFDCASNFEGHPQAPSDFKKQEERLLALSRLVVTDSDFLYEKMRKRHGNVEQIHQGVSESFFQAAPPTATPPWRRFCYYGTWVQDLGAEYLNALAGAGFDVTVSGFIKGNPPPFAPSIQGLPPVEQDKLVQRLEPFDVFLLPHHITPFHLGVVPAKLYECMAMGRPIIATPLPSLQRYRDLIYIAETPDQWVEIAKRLPETETLEKREARIRLAREHTHAREFDRLYEKLRQSYADRAKTVS